MRTHTHRRSENRYKETTTAKKVAEGNCVRDESRFAGEGKPTIAQGLEGAMMTLWIPENRGQVGHWEV